MSQKLLNKNDEEKAKESFEYVIRTGCNQEQVIAIKIILPRNREDFFKTFNN